MVVLRLTRHEPTFEQVNELTRIFGQETMVVTVSKTVSCADEVVELIKRYNADVLEVVLPVGLLADVIKKVRIPVIRAVMNRKIKENGDVEFTFSHYEKILSVDIITQKL